MIILNDFPIIYLRYLNNKHIGETHKEQTCKGRCFSWDIGIESSKKFKKKTLLGSVFNCKITIDEHANKIFMNIDIWKQYRN
jgi:hypothetical protein